MESQHPSFPSFNLSELDDAAMSNDALQGLVAMKYDPDDLNAQAMSYKEDGNMNFKTAKFDLAVDNYTAGIKVNCGDESINAALYFNRGMAHFKRANYRTALGDFDAASKLVSPYLKAVVKAAECCLHLKRFDDCLKWCQVGFDIEPENKLLVSTRDKCVVAKESAEIAEQKRLASAKRAEMEEKALMTALKSHGVRFHPLTVFSLDWFQSHCPQAKHPKFADGSGQAAICWPVVLSYPELKKQDFVESFNEELSFEQLLEMVLGAEAHRVDLDQAYSPSTADVYFENVFKRKLVQVDVSSSLLWTLRRSDLIVLEGTPSFVVLCKDRPDFIKEFTKNYDKVDLV